MDLEGLDIPSEMTAGHRESDCDVLTVCMCGEVGWGLGGGEEF